MSDVQYYDNVYTKLIADPENGGWKWLEERIEAVLPLIRGESVLDLGCGLAVIADRLDIAYRGLDYSPVCYEWNVANVKNPKASFGVGDIYKHIGSKGFDTVLVLEVLEHVHYPAWLCQIAMRAAVKRVIVSVPVNMPGKKHYHPRWCEQELAAMLGGMARVRRFGGPKKDRWLLGMIDYERLVSVQR